MIQFDYALTDAMYFQFSVPVYRFIEMELSFKTNAVMSGITGLKPTVKRSIDKYGYDHRTKN